MSYTRRGNRLGSSERKKYLAQQTAKGLRRGETLYYLSVGVASEVTLRKLLKEYGYDNKGNKIKKSGQKNTEKNKIKHIKKYIENPSKIRKYRGWIIEIQPSKMGFFASGRGGKVIRSVWVYHPENPTMGKWSGSVADAIRFINSQTDIKDNPMHPDYDSVPIVKLVFKSSPSGVKEYFWAVKSTFGENMEQKKKALKFPYSLPPILIRGHYYNVFKNLKLAKKFIKSYYYDLKSNLKSNPESVDALREQIFQYHQTHGKPSKYWLQKLAIALSKASAENLENTWKYICRVRLGEKC